MRSARSAVMLSGLAVNSKRLANSAANRPEKLMSTISTLGRFSRYDYYHHGYWSDASPAESDNRAYALHNGASG